MSTCCCPPRRDGTRSTRCVEVNPTTGDLRCRTERLIAEAVKDALDDPGDPEGEPRDVIEGPEVDVPRLLRVLAAAGIHVRVDRRNRNRGAHGAA